MDTYRIDIVNSYTGLIANHAVSRDSMITALNSATDVDESYDTFYQYFLNDAQIAHDDLIRDGYGVITGIHGEERHFDSRRDAIEYGRTMGLAAYSLIVDSEGRAHARFKKLPAQSELGRQLGL